MAREQKMHSSKLPIGFAGLETSTGANQTSVANGGGAAPSNRLSWT